MTSRDYINVPGWAVTELNLAGNELLLYSLINGYSQTATDISDDGATIRTENWCVRPISYMSKILGCCPHTTMNVLSKLLEKGLIEKKTVRRGKSTICKYRTKSDECSVQSGSSLSKNCTVNEVSQSKNCTVNEVSQSKNCTVNEVSQSKNCTVNEVSQSKILLQIKNTGITLPCINTSQRNTTKDHEISAKSGSAQEMATMSTFSNVPQTTPPPPPLTLPSDTQYPLIPKPQKEVKKETRVRKWINAKTRLIDNGEFSDDVDSELRKFLGMLVELGALIPDVSFQAQLVELSSVPPARQLQVVQDTISRGWKSLAYAIKDAKTLKKPHFDTAPAHNHFFKDPNNDTRWEQYKDDISF